MTKAIEFKPTARLFNHRGTILFKEEVRENWVKQRCESSALKLISALFLLLKYPKMCLSCVFSTISALFLNSHSHPWFRLPCGGACKTISSVEERHCMYQRLGKTNPPVKVLSYTCSRQKVVPALQWYWVYDGKEKENAVYTD